MRLALACRACAAAAEAAAWPRRRVGLRRRRTRHSCRNASRSPQRCGLLCGTPARQRRNRISDVASRTTRGAHGARAGGSATRRRDVRRPGGTGGSAGVCALYRLGHLSVMDARADVTPLWKHAGVRSCLRPRCCRTRLGIRRWCRCAGAGASGRGCGAACRSRHAPRCGRVWPRIPRGTMAAARGGVARRARDAWRGRSRRNRWRSRRNAKSFLVQRLLNALHEVRFQAARREPATNKLIL